MLIGFRAADIDVGTRERLFRCLFKASEWDGTWSLPLSKTKQTNILLLLRTIANAFYDESPITQSSWVNEVCRAAFDIYMTGLKNFYRFLIIWVMVHMKHSINRSALQLLQSFSSQSNIHCHFYCADRTIAVSRAQMLARLYHRLLEHCI